MTALPALGFGLWIARKKKFAQSASFWGIIPQRKQMSDFASYYASLPDDDLLRLTADVANLLPGAREALKREADKRKLLTEGVDWSAQPLTHRATLPYSWGKFQGWVMVICGVLAFFVMAGRGNIFGIIAAPFSAYTGYALLKRKRHGILLFYIGAGIAALFALFVDFGAVVGLLAATTDSAERSGYFLGQALTMTAAIVGWWLVPAIAYYRKRMPEFRKDAVVPEIPRV